MPQKLSPLIGLGLKLWSILPLSAMTSWLHSAKCDAVGKQKMTALRSQSVLAGCQFTSQTSVTICRDAGCVLWMVVSIRLCMLTMGLVGKTSRSGDDRVGLFT